jgi:hypothetical protein
MKLHCRVILLPLLSLLAAAGPATQSGTTQARCVVDVWSTLDFRPVLYPGHQTFAFDDVKAAICNELRQQANQMLGIPPNTLQEYVTFEPSTEAQNLTNSRNVPVSAEPYRLILSLTLDDKAQPVAREFMDKMLDVLPQVIDRMEQADLEKRMDDVMRARTEAQVRRQQAADRINAVKNLGVDARTADEIDALARGLDEQSMQLTLDVASISAERAILSGTIDQINAEAAHKAADDPVAAQLQTIVDLKEKKLGYVQSEARGGNPPELSDAEADAAEARVQLLERREAVERAAAGDALADFQKQLVLAEVTLAQDQARLNAISKKLSSLNQARDLFQQSDTSPVVNSDVDTSEANELRIMQQINAIPASAVRVVSESYK